MYIQDQLNHAHVNDENLAFYKAIGVDYLTVNPPPFAAGISGDLTGREQMAQYLIQVRDQAASHGLKLMNIALTGPDEITLARPERDAKIGQIYEGTSNMQLQTIAKQLMESTGRH